MDKETVYHLSFSHFLGIGPIRFGMLINYFGSAEKGYKANRKELEKIIGISLTEKFIEFRKTFDYGKKIEELKNKKINVISKNNKDYPFLLKNISDSPICLYIKGDISKVALDKNNFFAIVGTRKPSSYGRQIAKKLSFNLALAGFTIVSGLAMGIDTISHLSCLEAKRKTIAVLGCGVDIVYPTQNIKLYQKIANDGGLIIAEFPPGKKVSKGLFISRNRIISGLSRGVMVIEGSSHSGSLITARYAGIQGREVFATPGPITSYLSSAPNILLKQGAKLVTNVQDILDEFNINPLPNKKKELSLQLKKTEKSIFQAILKEPQSADKLSLLIELPISNILKNISLLEIKGLIEKNNSGNYQIKE